jgi:hypothetical protein
MHALCISSGRPVVRAAASSALGIWAAAAIDTAVQVLREELAQVRVHPLSDSFVARRARARAPPGCRSGIQLAGRLFPQLQGDTMSGNMKDRSHSRGGAAVDNVRKGHD